MIRMVKLVKMVRNQLFDDENGGGESFFISISFFHMHHYGTFKLYRLHYDILIVNDLINYKFFLLVLNLKKMN